MIASVQTTSGIRAFRAPVAASTGGDNSSSTTDFHSVINTYHSEAHDDSNGSSEAETSSATDEVRSGLYAQQQTVAAAKARAKTDARSATLNDQSQEVDRLAGNFARIKDSNFRALLRKIRGAKLADSQNENLPATPKSSSDGAVPILQIPLQATEPVRVVPPFTASFTLRQDGDASQDSPAVSSESAAATQLAPPVPLSPPQIQVEDGAASGSLAFAARLNPNADSKTTGSQTSARLARPDAADSIGRSHQEDATEAAISSSAKQFLTGDNSGGSAGDPTNTSGDGAAPRQNPSELFATSQVVAQPTPENNQTTPSQSTVPNQAVAPSAHLDKAIDATTSQPSANHDITVRIPSSTDQSMSVRFLERGGEVRVAVRTADSEMAQTLQGGLNQLVNRLQESGIQTEVWQPGSDASTPQEHQNPFTNPDGSNGNSSSSDSGQESGQQNKPRWLEEFENSIGNPEETPQLWQV